MVMGKLTLVSFGFTIEEFTNTMLQRLMVEKTTIHTILQGILLYLMFMIIMVSS